MEGYKVYYASRYFYEQIHEAEFYTINKDILAKKVESMIERILKYSNPLSQKDFDYEVQELISEAKSDPSVEFDVLEIKKPYIAYKYKTMFNGLVFDDLIIVKVYEKHIDEDDEDYSSIDSKSIIIKKIDILE